MVARYVLFILLIILFGLQQAYLKEAPQFFMIFLGVAILVSSKKVQILSTVLFYLLLGILLYSAIFNVFMLVLGGYYNPTVTVDNGIIYPIMNMTPVFIMPIAAIFSPLMLLFYHRHLRKGDIKTERLATIGFTITTTSIFLIETVIKPMN